MTRSAPLAERALYLTLVLAALLVFGVLAGIELLERATTRIFGFRPENDFGFGSDSGASLATVIVTGSAWLYHVAIRQRDLRAGPLTGAAAWMPRAYLYGATLAGLIFTAYNIGTLLGAGWRPPPAASSTTTSDSRPSARPPSPSPESSDGASSGSATGGTRLPSRAAPAGERIRSERRACGSRITWRPSAPWPSPPRSLPSWR